MPGKKRQRSKDKPEKEPSQKRAAAAPVPLPSLAGMRGVVLRGEGGEPLSLFMRRAVEGNGRKVVILVDNGVDTSEILTAISRAGEISNHRERRCQDGDTTLPLIEVEFETEDAAKRCVNLQSKPPTTGPDGEPVGLKRWLMEAESRSHMDEEELQREVDEFMEAFERRKEEVERAKEAQGGVPDADGFILVTRKGRDPAAQEASENRKRKRKRGMLEAQDFYRFQRREKKIAQLEDLRARFEEDKERIRKMKEARMFKPF